MYQVLFLSLALLSSLDAPQNAEPACKMPDSLQIMEVVRTGMSRSEVEQILSGRGIAFSYASTAKVDDPRPEVMARLKTLSGRIVTRATLPKMHSLIISEEVTVIEIGKKDTVSSLKCIVVHTGP